MMNLMEDAAQCNNNNTAYTAVAIIRPGVKMILNIYDCFNYLIMHVPRMVKVYKPSLVLA